MSKLELKNILKGHLNRSESDSSHIEDEYVLSFSSEGEEYFCDLSIVKEVLEVIPITPYPTPIGGHLGVINVRGRIIPVLSSNSQCQSFLKMTDDESIILNEKKYRIIVFESEEFEPFSIIVSGVFKNVISDRENEYSEVVNINSIPYKYFDAKFFITARDRASEVEVA